MDFEQVEKDLNTHHQLRRFIDLQCDESKIFAALFYENERPLRGLAGHLDWISCGKLSETVRKGKISPELGECSLIVFPYGKKILQALVLGAGELDMNGDRSPIHEEFYEPMLKHFLSLRLKTLIFLKEEIPTSLENEIKKGLEGKELCILQ